MTEDEAKTKWCPFARVACDANAAWNRAASSGGSPAIETIELPTLCIASACMAWRGKETAEFKSRAEAAFRRDGARLAPGPSDTQGFCGLAGQPS